MRKFVLILSSFILSASVLSAGDRPVLQSRDTLLSSAFSLAVRTVEGNIQDGIIKAGDDYGGEWARDASINAWNACSLLFPEEARASLWAVTLDGGSTVGHQYWDKIIWVPGALNHVMVTGDPLEPVYRCSAATMEELEGMAYDNERHLFTGPSVFNDGIAGYEAPVPDDSLRRSGAVYHPNTANICCLSTNCLYYLAYRDLAVMSMRSGKPIKALSYLGKAAQLRRAIRRTFYDRKASRLYYLVDHEGNAHQFQEALGYAFAILSGVVDRREARALLDNAHVSDYGVCSIYPDFKRFDREHPGRHNNIVWPFVNAFWAEAALGCGRRDMFLFELRNLANLAVNKGEGMFYEIYNPHTGEPDGGWQLGIHWNSCRDQTWSATGYLRMVVTDLFGLRFGRRGMSVCPDLEAAAALGCTALEGIRYRNHDVSIRLEPSDGGREGIYVNGKRVCRAFVPCRGSESYEIIIRRKAF